MYIIRWKSDNDVFVGGSGYHWDKNRTKALFFESERKALNAIESMDSTWLPHIEVEYMHPLNLR